MTVHNGKGSYLAPNMQYSVFGGNVTGGGYDEIVSLYKQTTRESSIYKFEKNSSGTFYLYNNLWNSQIYELSDTASTSTRVASETIGGDVYTYTYDTLGNITEIALGNDVVKEFEYDSLGELISEDIKGKQKTVYTYDNGGNITSGTKYLYVNGTLQSTGTVTVYGYSDTNWHDLLTSFDNQSIVYDAIGNPTNYLGNTLSWTDGRKLSAVGNISSYTYDFSGIRTKKISGGVTHEYLLDGSKIICEKRSDGITLHFYYDASGNIFAFDKGNTRYYYVRNILGEILGIIDTDGSYVVKYTYDEWGKPLAITDGAGIDVSDNSSHIANINPFRYKGYYYDTETGFYYLQSRYYDPYVGRFINADSFVSTGTGFLGYNMFAYCNNNPVMLLDPSGTINLYFDISGIKENQAAGVLIGIVVLGYLAQIAQKSNNTDLSIGSANSSNNTSDIVTIGLCHIQLHPLVADVYVDDISDSEIGSVADTTEASIEGHKKQNYFPIDPENFTPIGLIPDIRLGTFNGKIINWKDPITKEVIFEWDEDYRYGSHYHINSPLCYDKKGKRIHFYAFDAIPEPWNSIYFGG